MSSGQQSRIQPEERIEQRTKELALVTDYVPALICYIDHDGRYRSMNRPYEEFLNVRHGEAIGRHVSEVLGERYYQAEARGRMERALAGQTVTFDTISPREGEVRYLSATYTPDISVDGVVRGFVVLAIDLTERKYAELRDAFLVRLDDATRPLTDSGEIVQTAARLLGEHLDVNRSAYADVEDDEDTFNLIGDYNRGVQSIVGRYTFTQFGAECLRLMRGGKPYVVKDSETDARTADVRESYRLTRIRAVICVSLRKADRFVAAMAVHQTNPRQWRPDEVELVQLVANRCWESIERTRVTRELQASEDQFRTLANTIPNLAWMAHPDGHIFWYNRRWYEYTGTSPEEMEGWGWQRVHNPDVLPSVLERWKTSIATGEPFEMIFPLRSRSGAFRPFLTRVEPVKDARGRVTRWFGTNTDIAAQQEAERRLSAAVLGSPFPIMLHAEDGEVLALSRSWTDLTGYAPEELRTHQDWFRLAYPEHYEAALIHLAAEFDRVDVTRVGEIALRTKSGAERIWDFQTVPLGRLPDGRRLQMSAAVDVTERKTAEVVLQSSNESLQRANRELEEFAFVASHDLQEPLRMINVYTQLLLRRYGEKDDPETQEFAGFVQRGVQRMEHLIKDLLSYSRTVHAEQQERRPSRLQVALDEALTMVDTQVEETRAEIIAGDLPVVLADESQLTQLFQNLLSNALKYRKPDEAPRIVITAKQNGGDWLVSVQDNGIGFEQKFADRIFGLFKRLHKNAYPGTGLGLAICKRIIERHGGRIWAESMPGIGSTFYFSLPAADTSGTEKQVT